jgi:polar amino acid transport system substrate-binding protein
VVIEGAYMVKNDSPLTDNDQADKPGHRIAVGKGSAYDLYLTRNIKNATIERFGSSQEVVDGFLVQGLEVAAGVKQQLELDAKRVAGLRLLPGRFMEIRQAIGAPKGRGEEAGVYLLAFIEELKATGFVAEALKRHGIEGAAVAPAGR